MSDRDGQQGPSSPGGQGGSPAGGRRTRPGEDLAQEFWVEVRHGAHHFPQWGGRAPPGRVRQFFHGLSLPFHLARALLADPVARGRYLRVSLLQMAATVLLVVLYLGSCKETAEFVTEESRTEQKDRRKALREAAKALAAQRREAEATARRVEEAQAAADRALRAVGVTPPPRPPGAPEAGGPRPEAAEASAPGSEDAGARRAEAPAPPGEDAQAGAMRPADAGTAEPGAPVAGALSPRDAGVAATPGQATSEAEERLAQRLRDVEAAARGSDAGTSLAEALAALALELAALEEADDSEDLEDDATPALEDGGTAVATQGTAPPGADGEAGSEPAPRPDGEEASRIRTVLGISLWNLAFWGWLLTALQVAQWVVIALSREYHDAIARDASLLTGVEPEDEELTPRVRLDMAWIRKKVKRRWRAFVLFAAGLPVVWLLAMPFFCSSTLASLLSTAWAAWWWVVFTAAKSCHAWELPAVPRPPWFLRAWTWVTTRVPGLRWGLPRRYGAFLARRTEEVRAPIATAERHPWAFAGLALVHFLGTLPPMKFFLRPVIPVAAAHLLAAEAAARADQQPPPPRPVIPAGETGS